MGSNCLKAKATTRTVYFFLLGPQEFLVLIWSTSERWKAESNFVPPNGFELSTFGLGIQHPSPLDHCSKSLSLPRNLVLGPFDKLLIVLSTKANLLYLLYSTAQRCCILHLMKQNCLLKTFLKTLILMTWVSLYLFVLLELIWNCIIFI